MKTAKKLLFIQIEYNVIWVPKCTLKRLRKFDLIFCSSDVSPVIIKIRHCRFTSFFAYLVQHKTSLYFRVYNLQERIILRTLLTYKVLANIRFHHLSVVPIPATIPVKTHFPKTHSIVIQRNTIQLIK